MIRSSLFALLAAAFLFSDVPCAFGQSTAALIDAELAKWHALRDERLPAFNALIRERAIDLIGVPEE